MTADATADAPDCRLTHRLDDGSADDLDARRRSPIRSKWRRLTAAAPDHRATWPTVTSALRGVVGPSASPGRDQLTVLFSGCSNERPDVGIWSSRPLPGCGHRQVNNRSVRRLTVPPRRQRPVPRSFFRLLSCRCHFSCFSLLGAAFIRQK